MKTLAASVVVTSVNCMFCKDIAGARYKVQIKLKNR
jgi:hypothetical protein